MQGSPLRIFSTGLPGPVVWCYSRAGSRITGPALNTNKQRSCHIPHILNTKKITGLPGHRRIQDFVRGGGARPSWPPPLDPRLTIWGSNFLWGGGGGGKAPLPPPPGSAPAGPRFKCAPVLDRGIFSCTRSTGPYLTSSPAYMVCIFLNL